VIPGGAVGLLGAFYEQWRYIARFGRFGTGLNWIFYCGGCRGEVGGSRNWPLAGWWVGISRGGGGPAEPERQRVPGRNPGTRKRRRRSPGTRIVGGGRGSRERAGSEPPALAIFLVEKRGGLG
jgi:hypothetical protein